MTCCPHCNGTGVKPPRKAKTQPLASRPPSVANVRTRMWNSMRIQGTFTAPSITATSMPMKVSAAKARAKVLSCRHYIRALCEAGYVRVTEGTDFTAGKFTSFTLVRNTGPHAPRVRKDGKALFDCNLNQEVPRVRHQ